MRILTFLKLIFGEYNIATSERMYEGEYTRVVVMEGDYYIYYQTSEQKKIMDARHQEELTRE